MAPFFPETTFTTTSAGTSSHVIFVTLPTTGTATGFSVLVDRTGYVERPLDIPSMVEQRQRELLAWTMAALAIARTEQRTSENDPNGILTRRPNRSPSKRIHDRSRVKGRVCAGSSRYRVFRA